MKKLVMVAVLLAWPAPDLGGSDADCELVWGADEADEAESVLDLPVRLVA